MEVNPNTIYNLVAKGSVTEIWGEIRTGRREGKPYKLRLVRKSSKGNQGNQAKTRKCKEMQRKTRNLHDPCISLLVFINKGEVSLGF